MTNIPARPKVSVNFRFVHFCPVEKCERIMTDVEKSKISPHYIYARCEKFQISPHLSCGEIWHFYYDRCGEFSDFSTSVMWRNLTFLTWQMWRIFRIFHICYVWESNISPHDKFFSTYLICEICDKYQVCLAMSFVLLVCWQSVGLGACQPHCAVRVGWRDPQTGKRLQKAFKASLKMKVGILAHNSWDTIGSLTFPFDWLYSVSSCVLSTFTILFTWSVVSHIIIV